MRERNIYGAVRGRKRTRGIETRVRYILCVGSTGGCLPAGGGGGSGTLDCKRCFPMQVITMFIIIAQLTE